MTSSYKSYIPRFSELGAFTTYGILQIFIDNLNQPRQGTATDIAINSMKTMFDNRAGMILFFHYLFLFQI
jgi:hypothetical protein